MANQGFRLHDCTFLHFLEWPTNSTVSFSHIVQLAQQVIYNTLTGNPIPEVKAIDNRDHMAIKGHRDHMAIKGHQNVPKAKKTSKK